MIYKASLDKTSKVITSLVSLLFFSIIILQVILFIQHHNWVSLSTAVLLFLIYVATYLYHPVNYRIESRDIIVHRRASDIHLLRSNIKKIEVLGETKLNGSIRTFGVGGLFGYFGQFMNTELGCMTWYATKYRNHVVMIELNNHKKIILTPDEPEQFVHQIMVAA